MSCVVGLVHDGKVYLGADSASTNSVFETTIDKKPKAYMIGEFAIGCIGSIRVSQFLHYAFTPPPIEGDLMRYMVVDFVKALKDCLKADEQKDDNLMADSFLLVGVRGRLFMIDNDFQIEESLAPYSAIGCADNVALGSMHTSQEFEVMPLVRLQLALEAAQHHNAAVRAPFIYVYEGSEE